MRMRKKKNFDSRWAQVAPDYVIEQPSARQGMWRNGAQVLRLELGCGKGLYLTRQAALSPEVLHLGVERNPSVILLAMECAAREGLRNIQFICGDVDTVAEWFAEGEIDRLDVLFCDPWPALRHAKRRLTHHKYLAVYHSLLKNDGLFCFRTDNVGLYDFSVGEIDDALWEIVSQTRDLHGDGGDLGESMTGYEERFMALGQPIYQFKARKCK